MSLYKSYVRALVLLFDILFIECFCNKKGVGDPSKVRLCDEETGACKCKNKRIAGTHCDQCAASYEFPFPECKGII